MPRSGRRIGFGFFEWIWSLVQFLTHLLNDSLTHMSHEYSLTEFECPGTHFAQVERLSSVSVLENLGIFCWRIR